MEILKETAKRNWLSPKRRRQTVAEVRSRLGSIKLSARRACDVLDQPGSTQRYQSRRPDDEPRLLREVCVLARQRARFGAARTRRLLVERDWPVNPKRVHRLGKRENMQVRKKTASQTMFCRRVREQLCASSSSTQGAHLVVRLSD